MINADLTNAFFEMFGAVLSSTSIFALLKEKEVRGVSIWPSVFFITWGFQNLFFYKIVNQPISQIAAVFMLLSNIVWFGLALYYKRQNKNKYL